MFPLRPATFPDRNASVIKSNDKSIYNKALLIIIFIKNNIMILCICQCFFEKKLTYLPIVQMKKTEPPKRLRFKYASYEILYCNSFYFLIYFMKLEAYIQSGPQNRILFIGNATFHIPVFNVSNHVLGYSVFCNSIPAFCTFKVQEVSVGNRSP